VPIVKVAAGDILEFGSGGYNANFTGNVGIGTSSPTSKLTVVGAVKSASATQSSFYLSNAAQTNGFLLGRSLSSDDGQNFFIYDTVAAATRLYLDSSGNLGLGVTPNAGWGGATRAYDLQYYNTFSGGDDGSRAYMLLGSNFYESGGGTPRYKVTNVNIPATMYKQRNGEHQWLYAPNGTAGNAITFTQAMTLDASGRLGVGTTSPSTKFEVKAGNGGQMALNNDGSQYTTALWQNNGTSKVEAYWDQTNTLFAIGPTPASSTLVFQTAGSERARIDSTGKFYSLPTYNNTTGAAANMGVDSTAGVFYRSTSSLKYKRDVENYDKGLAEVMQLRSVYYKGTSERDGDTQYAGLIAEEVHDAGLPEFVQYAEDGTPDALAYGHMVSLLTKAIQEQQAIILSLKARLDAANL
jgi:hypothetical protein